MDSDQENNLYLMLGQIRGEMHTGFTAVNQRLDTANSRTSKLEDKVDNEISKVHTKMDYFHENQQEDSLKMALFRQSVDADNNVVVEKHNTVWKTLKAQWSVVLGILLLATFGLDVVSKLFL